MKFLLAKKVNMTQVFGEDGKVAPATVLNVEPMTVTQVKTKEKDGYDAIQIGAGKRSLKNTPKPVRGHLKDLDNLAILKEFRTDGTGEYKRGDKISIDIFAVGNEVEVSAISKGKGFQGVVKRHGFHGGPRSHGQKHSEREPGSIGVGGVQKVIKGMRMAGRMGGERVTIKGLKVLSVNKDNSEILISGAIPGRKGTWVEVKSQ